MNRLTFLSPEEVEAVHQATLRILGEIGIFLTLDEGRQILTGAGATIQGERVLLPPDLVERAMAACPHQVSIRGRGAKVKVLGDGSLYWHNLGGAPQVYDHNSGKHRPAVLQDVRDSTRLLDALDHATTITPFFTPTDVPGELMSLSMYRHALPYTTKPLQGPGVQNADEVMFALRMAEVIGPPAEVVSLSVSPVSPLIFSDDAAGAMIAIARAGVPFAPLPCPTAGTTAPFSIAGAVAEQLILISPAGTNSNDQEQIAFALTQLKDLKGKIEQAQADLIVLRKQVDASNSARQIQDLQNQIDTLEKKISGWQETYSKLLVTVQGGDVNALMVVEEASVPSHPISPNTKMNVLLAAAIGLALALGGIFVIEYLDDSIKTSEDITLTQQLPVIGIILFYYGGMKLFPRHAGNVSIASASLLVAFVIGANVAIFRKLKSLDMPMAYVKRVVFARALLYLSLAALICFFAVSQGSL